MIYVTDIVMVALDEGVTTPGIVEDITTYDDMTVHSVRCPYMGILYTREAEDLMEASVEDAARVRQHMEVLTPAVPELRIVHRSVGGFLITQGCVDAEIRRTQRNVYCRIGAVTGAPIIGINASSNMFA